ncbi:ATP-dependent RNA helicase DDX5/DBP2 [Strigomonas culicis]|uniref:RNA helicase n=1 Tax=Strigomonas culicis TaxID=28005 RepID=S9V4B4_9TRYP|nr:ATP-dependent RNA helicase DDX5/DBP2 [Strigomonas culicis]|eukprot:EPY21746.1 ATP-dependent RNA helicase DDX5/DBP2 [Strigomonas culicis]
MIPAIINVYNILKDEQEESGSATRLQGPFVLVLAPTRELAQQIEAETLKILPPQPDEPAATPYGRGRGGGAPRSGGNNNTDIAITCACIYGGAPKGPQIQQLRRRPQLLVATPGRLIDFLNFSTTNQNPNSYNNNFLQLQNVLFFILDEADRMLDMGFEPQVKEIAKHLMPKEHRLNLMFSATWPVEIQKLAKTFLKETTAAEQAESHGYIKINIGSTELLANKDVEQQFVQIGGTNFHQMDQQRFEALKKILVDLKQESLKHHGGGGKAGAGHDSHDGRVLVFVKTKKSADDIEFHLKKMGFDVMALHGDKEQKQREFIINCFKKGFEGGSHSQQQPSTATAYKNNMILVATDVAARGLDIKKLKLVVNYDFPMQLDDYVHRIGRTGRAGERGRSITFLTGKEDAFSSDATTLGRLIALVERAGQPVPPWLREWCDYRGSTHAQFFSGGVGGGGARKNKNFTGDFSKGKGAPVMKAPGGGDYADMVEDRHSTQPKKSYFGLDANATGSQKKGGGTTGSVSGYRYFTDSDSDTEKSAKKKMKNE